MKIDLSAVKNRFKRPDEFSFQVIRPFQEFFKKEASSSLLLIATTLAALVWANISYTNYYHFWHRELTISIGEIKISKSLIEWINEGLMTVFFFIVGLEIKRELLVGELASFKRAVLSVSAAIGGIICPALIYIMLNYGNEIALRGWGIPMATDIAFALGVLYLLGNRIPPGLRVFLSAFAIADDLGAVLVIALFYTEEIVIQYFLLSLLIILVLAIANFIWIRKILFYAVGAIVLWFFVLASGIHTTVVGIIIAMFIPSRGKYSTDRFLTEVGQYLSQFHCPPEGCGDSILVNRRHLNAVHSIELACHNVESPLQRLEHVLHPWVAFLIVPLFALANAGVLLEGVKISDIFYSPVSLGILLGLLIGKPVGITLFSFISVATGMAKLPAGVRWIHILGAGILGGIGFTMSLFITSLSFTERAYIDTAKLGILSASLLSAIAGLVVLYLVKVPIKTSFRRYFLFVM
jgi:NhaA family Na+:H+ antiporter